MKKQCSKATLKTACFGISMLLLSRTGTVFAEDGNWSIGIASAVQNTNHTGTDYQEYIFPYIRYVGENLNIDLTSVSYQFFTHDDITLKLKGQVRFDGFESSSSEFLSGMDDRDSAFDAGIEGSYNTDWATISAHWVTDVSDTHKGSEFQLSISQSYSFDLLTLSPYLSLSHLDSTLVNYYYGVPEEEANEIRLMYIADSDNTLSLGLNAIWQVTDKHQLITGVDYRVLGDEIADSPIVEEHNQLLFYIGWLYAL